MEKVYRVMKQGGITGIVIGIVSIVVGVTSGIVMIVNGARLLLGKNDVII